MNKVFLKKSNELVTARYYLPINTQKLICLCASKIQSDDISFDTLEITAEEFQMINKTENPYRDLKDASEDLFNAYIHGVDKHGNYTEKKRWVTTVRYYSGEGKVVFKFHDDIKEWLLQLKINFINYRLDAIESLFNKYSLRIYELLISNDNMKDDMYHMVISIEKLRAMLVLEDKYPKVNDLKRYLIDPVVEELNKTNLSNVSYNALRKGRVIDRFEFLYYK